MDGLRTATIGYLKTQFPYATAHLPCTTTLYHWINIGIMRTKNIDLLEKVSRAPRKNGRYGKDNKHKLSTSIKNRPKHIEDRAEFGHWKIDTVLAIKGDGDGLIFQACDWLGHVRSNDTSARHSGIETCIPDTDTHRGLILSFRPGSQYAALDYQALLREHDITTSMSRKGNCYDNACIESFHSIIKKELIHPARYQTREEASRRILEYIVSFYNYERIHAYLGYLSPIAFEKKYAG